MIIYNKLVRDLIPEIIEADNKSCSVEILNTLDFTDALKTKLSEEVEEYLSANTHADSLEELADILEVIHSLAKQHDSDMNTIEIIRQKKYKQRGGFQKQIFLKSVSKNE